MKQLKKALAAAGSGAVLALSMVGGASAAVTCTTSNSGVNGAQVQTCVDDSTNTTYTVSGNCSGIIQSVVTQTQVNGSAQGNGSTGGVFGDNNSTNTNNNSTSQSQTGGVTFAPDCSVTNVSQVAAAPAAAAAPQVKAPKGGVHAGGGAGASAASSTASIAGLVASTGALGLGAIVRKKAFLGL